MHWALQYIGLPWKLDAHGPEAFNCWSLVWWVQKKHYGRDVPEHLVPQGETLVDPLMIMREMHNAERSGKWDKLCEPVDGCVVGLSHREIFHHVGVYVAVDGGLVLHACERKGVLAQPLRTMESHGWNRIAFFQHTSWPK